jgi:hypothetical protein
MEPNLDPSAQKLAIVICFILVAYIFYFLGSNHPNVSASVAKSESNPLGLGPSDVTASDTNPEYLRGFRDGRKAFLSLGIHDFQQEARQESRKLERELKKKLQEVDKQEKARQQWFEDELEMRWRQKQIEEKGIVGWFRFGGRKKSRRAPEQSPNEEKESTEQWIDEKKAVAKSG